MVKVILPTKEHPFQYHHHNFTTCRSLHGKTLVLGSCSLGAWCPRWDHHGTLGAASGGHTAKQLERSSALGATWSSGWRCWSGMKCWWTKILQISYGWWFQICFMFTPIWGKMIQFDSYFSNGLKPPTSSVLVVEYGNFVVSIHDMFRVLLRRILEHNITTGQ